MRSTSTVLRLHPRLRGLLNTRENQFRATETTLVTELITEDRGWPDGDIRRSFLDTQWMEICDVANISRHPEGDVNIELFGEGDARWILLLTAASPK